MYCNLQHKKNHQKANVEKNEQGEEENNFHAIECGLQRNKRFFFIFPFENHCWELTSRVVYQNKQNVKEKIITVQQIRIVQLTASL